MDLLHCSLISAYCSNVGRQFSFLINLVLSAISTVRNKSNPQHIYTTVKVFLGKEVREATPDGEGKRAQWRNKKACDFTHFLAHKSTLLSRLSLMCDCIGKAMFSPRDAEPRDLGRRTTRALPEI